MVCLPRYSPLAATVVRGQVPEGSNDPCCRARLAGGHVSSRSSLTRSAPRCWPSARPVRFEDDEILLVQGDFGDFLYVLTSGLVKVIVAAESGVETTLAIRSRGDLVGEFALLDDKPRTATARAARPGHRAEDRRRRLPAITGGLPAAQAAVTRYLLSKMRASTERRAAERVWDARERLAQVLYELGERHAEPDAPKAPSGFR